MISHFINKVYFFPWQIKIFFCIIAILIISSLEIVFFILPQRHSIQQLSESLSQEQQKYRNYLLEIRTANQIRMERKIILHNLIKQLPSIQSHFTLSFFVDQIVQLSKICGLKLIAIKPEESVELNGWHKQLLDFELSGNDLNFIHWLWLLGQKPWLWYVNELEIQKTIQGIKANLQLTIYYG